METICKFHGIKRGTMEVACDSLSALRVGAVGTHVAPTTPDFDLLTDIQLLLSESPLTWQWRHVKGHQCLHTHSDCWTKWNHLTDCKAKGYWTQIQASPELPTALHPYQPVSHWSLCQGPTRWSHLNCDRLYWETYGVPLKDWWVSHGQILDFTKKKAC